MVRKPGGHNKYIQESIGNELKITLSPLMLIHFLEISDFLMQFTWTNISLRQTSIEPTGLNDMPTFHVCFLLMCSEQQWPC